MVVASNTRLYGGLLTMAPDAFVDDGLLDMTIFYGRGLREIARHASKMLLGLHRGDPEAEVFQTSHLRVEARQPLPVQLDGDYFCQTPVEITVAPRALRVIVPPGTHPQFRGIGGWEIGDRKLRTHPPSPIPPILLPTKEATVRRTKIVCTRRWSPNPLQSPEPGGYARCSARRPPGRPPAAAGQPECDLARSRPRSR